MIQFVYLVWAGLSAFAYIPDYGMILSRVAENHGRGAYRIEQDVVFPHSPEPLLVKETWFVTGENSMRMVAEGKGPLKGLLQLNFVYEGQQRMYLDGEAQKRVAKVHEDWLEPFFHFRFSKNIRSRLVALNIAPSESLRDRSGSMTGEKEARGEARSFLRLARSGGVVTYAVGAPTPVDASQLKPGLWIEQDQFVVRKVRGPTQSEVIADQYSRYGENFWLPKLRTYRWNNTSVQVFVSQVKSLGKSYGKDLLSLPSGDAAKDASSAAMKLPDEDVVRDFYSRFR